MPELEEDTTAYVECPVLGGEAEDASAVIKGDTLVWACPKCHDEHSAPIDLGDDEGWLEGIEAERIDCE